jgi:hypothetical protein
MGEKGMRRGAQMRFTATLRLEDDAGDGGFSFPSDAWKTGGGKRTILDCPGMNSRARKS